MRFGELVEVTGRAAVCHSDIAVLFYENKAGQCAKNDLLQLCFHLGDFTFHWFANRIPADMLSKQILAHWSSLASFHLKPWVLLFHHVSRISSSCESVDKIQALESRGNIFICKLELSFLESPFCPSCRIYTYCHHIATCLSFLCGGVCELLQWELNCELPQHVQVYTVYTWSYTNALALRCSIVPERKGLRILEMPDKHHHSFSGPNGAWDLHMGLPGPMTQTSAITNVIRLNCIYIYTHIFNPNNLDL